VAAEFALRVTRRALADVGLKALAGPKVHLEASKHQHPILETFVEKRGNEPIGQEQTLGIKAPVYNLHARNPWRGVTWYDEQSKVCRLLGVTARDYNELVARAKVGDLEPTVDDYADLEAARSVVPSAADEATVIAAITEEGRAPGERCLRDAQH
jgi:hypothetical protein